LDFPDHVTVMNGQSRGGGENHHISEHRPNEPGVADDRDGRERQSFQFLNWETANGKSTWCTVPQYK
jgi:hypothetical protein